MCGIYCNVQNIYLHNCPSSTDLNDSLCVCQEKSMDNSCKTLLRNRGPDGPEYSIITLDENRSLYFAGQVLWQQGNAPIAQPIETEHGILLFNGDVFGGKFSNSANLNDALVLSEALKHSNVLNVFSEIEGPFSFIYFDKENSILHFGRDCLGRHSLLLNRTKDGIIITSVAKRHLKCIEIPAVGIFSLGLASLQIELNLWKPLISEFCQEQLRQFEEYIQMTVLISAEYVLNATISALPEDEFNFETLLATSASKDFHQISKMLLATPQVNTSVKRLINLLSDSVRARVLLTPPFCKRCILNQSHCLHPKVGILFSGGLDCSILAVLADKFIPANIPIDLLNVAFETIQNNCHSKIKGNDESSNNVEMCNNLDKLWNVPDRLTGLSSLYELRRLMPNRIWNFVEININRSTLKSDLPNRISDLVNPLVTILDESLGSALWYASRGQGAIRTLNGETIEFKDYESPTRVLLMGMGADELFGGYSSHRAAFKNNKWHGLEEVLKLHFDRMPYRNLGRDDRVVADNSVQGRAPYLEEHFVDYVMNLKPYQRCFPVLPVGIGDKLLLRLLAHQLGLASIAILPKRALQFGSRIADKKQNAQDISQHFIL